MKETTFQNEFNEYMTMKFPVMWFVKVHGHEMQRSSLPDFVYCINGVFVGIEFKVQRDGKISTNPGQIREVNKVKDAKGIGLFVAFDEDNGSILIRERRLDYKKIFLKDKKPKKKPIRIDWDFKFNNYEDAVALVGIMVENIS